MIMKKNFKFKRIIIILLFLLSQNLNSQTWSSVGPIDPTDPTYPNAGYSGQMDFVQIDPSNRNILFAGTCMGGLFKIDLSQSTPNWICLTDNILLPSAWTFVVDYTDSDIIYIMSGTCQNSIYRQRSFRGIYKTIDGGQSWDFTSLQIPVNGTPTEYLNYFQPYGLPKIIMHPTDPLILYVCTAREVFKTSNGGDSWIALGFSDPAYISDTEAPYNDIEFNYTNPNILYISGDNSKLFKYDDTAYPNKITSIASNLQSSLNNSHIRIATKGDILYVWNYIDANNMFYEKSVTAGQTFTPIDGGPSFTSISHPSNFDTRQTTTSLLLEISPDGDIYSAGIALFRLKVGASAWSQVGTSYSTFHDDTRSLAFLSNDTVFIAHDGGIHKMSGNNFTRLNYNLVSNICLSVSTSDIDPDMYVSGHGDNGTIIKDGKTVWTRKHGGDGGITNINRTNPTYYFYSNNRTYKCTKPSSTSYYSGDFNYNRPIIQDPVTSTTFFSGAGPKIILPDSRWSELYKSTNDGSTFSVINLYGWTFATSVDVCKANPNYIFYAGYYDGQGSYFGDLQLSMDGGENWSDDLSSGLSNLINDFPISSVRFDPLNPNKAWVCFRRNTSGDRVFVTNNAGANWSGYSTGLPSQPVNSLIYDDLSKTLYIALDGYVYKRGEEENQWSLFSSGLPQVQITELKINNTKRTLVASTFGRGIFEIDLPINNENSTVLNINQDITWSSDFRVCRNINLKSNSILTIEGNITLTDNVRIICETGSKIIITPSGTLNICDNSKILVDGTMQIENLSHINIYGSGKIEVNNGGYFCVKSGANISLSDLNSCINLYTGSNLCIPTCPTGHGCITLIQNINKTGLGTINNSFDTDVFIQNTTISNSNYYTGRNIFVGRDVDVNQPYGDVIINNGANIILNAENAIIFSNGVRQTSGTLILEKRK